jgi:hypothetical protein
MKSLRSIVIVLAWTICALMIVQTAADAGKGGKGSEAAVNIDTILLIDPLPQGGNILAEISGGGFLGGEFLEVTMDGVALVIEPGASQEMLGVTIPGVTSDDDGDHLIEVRTGEDNKHAASATIRLGGEMIVSCISWFRSGPDDEHVHTEVHVEDENGEAVIGAMVTWTAENDLDDPDLPDGVYQTNVSATYDNDGHAHELTTCPLDENGVPDVSGSGVTGWYCCIGAGKWDNEPPPGKRACSPGLYTARIVDVAAPLFTNMVWNEDLSVLEESITLEGTRFP